ncbi:MAG: hypothetical protein JOY96_00595 [Verrucomicrobia bacterium]|nr:hypothetical protein [Verrucomicrobiota bacterium]MBV9674154.1 hypothetical protein [Verrucomicrobiota bacterium]
MSRLLDKIFANESDRYFNFSPGELCKRCSLNRDRIPDPEFRRAQWMWERRPKHVCVDAGRILWGRLLVFCALVLALTCLDVPGLLGAAALSAVGAGLLTIDFYYGERWRRDYDAFVSRMLKDAFRSR